MEGVLAHEDDGVARFGASGLDDGSETAAADRFLDNRCAARLTFNLDNNRSALDSKENVTRFHCYVNQSKQRFVVNFRIGATTFLVEEESK